MRALLFISFLFLLTSLSCKKVESSSQLELDPDIARLKTSVTVQVREWEAYNELENNLKLICNTNPLNAITLRQEMKDNINEMHAHIPENLRTELIKQQVAQIDQEVMDFYNNVPIDEIQNDVVERHLKAIMKSFDALNKSLNQTLVQN